MLDLESPLKPQGQVRSPVRPENPYRLTKALDRSFHKRLISLTTCTT